MTRHRLRTLRPAAALLVVLATLVLSVSASVALAQLAATGVLARQSHSRVAVSDDLLIAAQEPILSWLNGRSSTIVLPPDAPEPCALVLHDRIMQSGAAPGVDPIELRIWAFDQCGMAPLEHVRGATPIRLALPLQYAEQIDRLPSATDLQHPGLDMLTEVSSVFPEGGTSRPLTWSSSGTIEPPEAPSIEYGRAAGVGGAIATHNPGVINVNTAPIPLVEAAMRWSGMGGLEQVIAARKDGKLAPAASGSAATSRSENPSLVKAVQLVAVSSVWSFRIDVQVGPVRRSWWAVYTNQGSSTWRCVQRLAIDE